MVLNPEVRRRLHLADSARAAAKREPKPLNRALSFMGLEKVVPADEEWSVTPACKRPRLADSVLPALDGPMRVVPPTTVHSPVWYVLNFLFASQKLLCMF